MSKFQTSIPVDVASIIKALPEGAHLDQVEFNEEESRVEVHWQHDRLVTPYDHAQEFPIDALEDGKLPKGVKDRRKPERTEDRTEADQEVLTTSVHARATEKQTADPEVPPAVPTEAEMQGKLDGTAKPRVPTQRKNSAAGKKPKA